MVLFRVAGVEERVGYQPDSLKDANELTIGHTGLLLTLHAAFGQHRRHYQDEGLRAPSCCICLGEALPVITNRKLCFNTGQ